MATRLRQYWEDATPTSFDAQLRRYLPDKIQLSSSFFVVCNGILDVYADTAHSIFADIFDALVTSGNIEHTTERTTTHNRCVIYHLFGEEEEDVVMDGGGASGTDIGFCQVLSHKRGKRETVRWFNNCDFEKLMLAILFGHLIEVTTDNIDDIRTRWPRVRVGDKLPVLAAYPAPDNYPLLFLRLLLTFTDTRTITDHRLAIALPFRPRTFHWMMSDVVFVPAIRRYTSTDLHAFQSIPLTPSLACTFIILTCAHVARSRNMNITMFCTFVHHVLMTLMKCPESTFAIMTEAVPNGTEAIQSRQKEFRQSTVNEWSSVIAWSLKNFKILLAKCAEGDRAMMTPLQPPSPACRPTVMRYVQPVCMSMECQANGHCSCDLAPIPIYVTKEPPVTPPSPPPPLDLDVKIPEDIPPPPPARLAVAQAICDISRIDPFLDTTPYAKSTFSTWEFVSFTAIPKVKQEFSLLPYFPVCIFNNTYNALPNVSSSLVSWFDIPVSPYELMHNLRQLHVSTSNAFQISASGIPDAAWMVCNSIRGDDMRSRLYTSILTPELIAMKQRLYLQWFQSATKLDLELMPVYLQLARLLLQEEEWRVNPSVKSLEIVRDTESCWLSVLRWMCYGLPWDQQSVNISNTTATLDGFLSTYQQLKNQAPEPSMIGRILLILIQSCNSQVFFRLDADLAQEWLDQVSNCTKQNTLIDEDLQLEVDPRNPNYIRCRKDQVDILMTSVTGCNCIKCSVMSNRILADLKACIDNGGGAGGVADIRRSSGYRQASNNPSSWDAYAIPEPWIFTQTSKDKYPLLVDALRRIEYELMLTPGPLADRAPVTTELEFLHAIWKIDYRFRYTKDGCPMIRSDNNSSIGTDLFWYLKNMYEGDVADILSESLTLQSE